MYVVVKKYNAILAAMELLFTDVLSPCNMVIVALQIEYLRKYPVIVLAV